MGAPMHPREEIRGGNMVKKIKKVKKDVKSIVKNIDMKKVVIVVVGLAIVYAIASGMVA